MISQQKSQLILSPDNHEIVVQQSICNFLWQKHKEVEDHSRITEYLFDHNYENVSSHLAGLASQIVTQGNINNHYLLENFRDYKFISGEVLETYFPVPEGLEIFLAHLNAEQKVLDLCLRDMDAQKDDTDF